MAHLGCILVPPPSWRSGFGWRGLGWQRCVVSAVKVFPVEAGVLCLHVTADTSWSSLQAHNNTFETFSDENLLSVDPRGFKRLVQAEAATFLHPDQLRLNAIVTTVRTARDGVAVVLQDGTELVADYALCTFSLGVLQHDDVAFTPPLPAWKREAIHSTSMVRSSIKYRFTTNSDE